MPRRARRSAITCPEVVIDSSPWSEAPSVVAGGDTEAAAICERSDSERNVKRSRLGPRFLPLGLLLAVGSVLLRGIIRHPRRGQPIAPPRREPFTTERSGAAEVLINGSPPSLVPLSDVGADVHGVATGELLEPELKAKRSSLRSRFITGLLLFGGITVLALGITIRVANLHIATVVSNSMQPTFSAGDLVVTQTVPTSSIQVGDVIEFVPPTGGRTLIHRIASLENGVITTRGDANSVADPWHLTLSGTSVDRLVATVPFAGWLTELRWPALLLAGALVALIVLLELGKEVRKRFSRSRIQPQS